MLGNLLNKFTIIKKNKVVPSIEKNEVIMIVEDFTINKVTLVKIDKTSEVFERYIE